MSEHGIEPLGDQIEALTTVAASVTIIRERPDLCTGHVAGYVPVDMEKGKLMVAFHDRANHGNVMVMNIDVPATNDAEVAQENIERALEVGRENATKMALAYLN